ncbi:PREDICTED: uncharacterized protein LOC104820344 [Tarenaya hassleriana]|uniref:uncharacterized protein LOC104820344 n=1 Tax=Tarenaya hassleriana TaxID=28532 RepID=UPI00053C2F4E|nr:PREDICTED: uncharacterized protein LOC104820344 [Tarenaya hassleriana]XP_010549053.1 PREDICTED: uncharacterized protein LOC104820344 [Tarenaya hassleriana]XP_010549054.1 PREDICTED: uncharacterized protein LOC104820344 [Tarenaya hassleriana]XP_010549055.1 PREDICTED: uncharacterized protein LOC104820344 [Tarenaya hassleriana]
MNFLLRSASSATHQPVIEPVNAAPEPPAETTRPAATLEGLIAEESFPHYPPVEDHDRVTGDDNGTGDSSAQICGPVMDRFSDVSEEEGWIAIPYKEIPENWADAADIHSLLPLDRSFVFPGEQVQVLACLSASKGETEIITPFKVAEVMSRSGQRKFSDRQNGHMSEFGDEEMSLDGEFATQNGENPGKESLDSRKDVTNGESILRMEDHMRQTEELLRRFQNSHFFVRIAESGEPLWSKKSSLGTGPETDETGKSGKGRPCVSAFIDRGEFDPNAAGGVARSSAKCCALPNGDIVVSLQVNVADSPNDPVMEILQFEKHWNRDQPPESYNNTDNGDKDPYGDLLKWLIPLDNTIPQPSSSLSPSLSSSPGISSTSHRSAISATSGSQLFSFGHFRSYSMSSLPPNTVPAPGPIKAQTSKPSFEIGDWDSHSAHKLLKGQKSGTEELLSFRSVALERDRFSVRCGLEGICIPGRRWRRKLEIIQPVQIHSFTADCNTDDLLCVQIKNVAPAHNPDIVIYVDAISIVFEEAGKSATPSAVPIACIEAGNDHSLPNLTLRTGEEHSFIVKPTSSARNNLMPSSDRKKLPVSSLSLRSVNFERKKSGLNDDQYAILVSCRCNYTESRLFFKQRTDWRPRAPRDLMISVASEMSGEPCGPHGRASQLPVQVLTLQASNLSSEDLSLTVLAPTSFASPPSVVSLNSTPTSPVSPFLGFSEFTERVQSEKRGSMMRKLNSLPPIALKAQTASIDSEGRSASFNERPSNPSDVVPKSGLGCTHLWLQSRVPLGCVPSQSTATIKMELLPLTDGIITLDTLQIHVKEKGRRYVPEQSLKINAKSSISTGIM